MMTSSKAARAARRAGRWLKDRLVEDVPDSLALCEFGCRKPECRAGEWAQCERRLGDLKSRRKWKAART